VKICLLALSKSLLEPIEPLCWSNKLLVCLLNFRTSSLLIYLRNLVVVCIYNDTFICSFLQRWLRFFILRCAGGTWVFVDKLISDPEHWAWVYVADCSHNRPVLCSRYDTFREAYVGVVAGPGLNASVCSTIWRPWKRTLHVDWISFRWQLCLCLRRSKAEWVLFISLEQKMQSEKMINCLLSADPICSKLPAPVFFLQIFIYRACGTNEIKSAALSSRFWMESS
jgi:hypothetical protein